MVTNANTSALIKSLEKFLIANNNFQLTGENYEVMFISPQEAFGEYKYDLVVSAKCLDNLKKPIYALISHLQATLTKKNYEIIGGVNVCNTKEPLAHSLKRAYRLEQEITEVFNISAPMSVENFYDYGILLRSFALDKLILKNDLEIITTQYPNPIIGKLNGIDNHFNLTINAHKNDLLKLDYDLISKINLIQTSQHSATTFQFL